MTEIFLIAYQFPPLNVGGSFRPARFVKYFNEFNIKPIVFTLDPDDYPKIYPNKKKDSSILNDIKNINTDIIYVKADKQPDKKNNRLLKFLRVYFNITKGREHKTWKKIFFTETERALKKYSPAAIIVTAPPFGIINLAVKLSKKTNIPLIIDMRDSLSMWVAQPYGSKLHYLLTLKKEFKWFNFSEKIIAVTDQMVKDWISVHKKISLSKFEVIPNGYEKQISFKKAEIMPGKDIITIGYVGSFYYNPESRDSVFKPWYKKRLHRKLQFVPRKEDWLYRSPFFLFKTLSLLFSEYPDYKKRVFVKFAGIIPDWLDEMIKKFNLEANVKTVGFLSFEKIKEFYQSCDMLLITSVKVIGGEDYCIAGKTFDYIETGKPILGFVTEGAQKQFLQKSGVGIICNPDDEKKSAQILKSVIDNGVKLNPDEKFLSNFHGKSLTEKLSKIIYSFKNKK